MAEHSQLPFRLCGYCKTWNNKPCGDQCAWSTTDPTVTELYNSAWDQSSTKLFKLEGAARKALNYIENTENELDIKLSCGDYLRAALASLKE